MNVENLLEKHEHTLVIFLDISGAFNSVWHPDVIFELIKKHCPVGYIKLIMSYLSDRIVTLMANGHKASMRLSASSPQGSVISDFIWNLISDTLLKAKFPEKVKAVLPSRRYKKQCLNA